MSKVVIKVENISKQYRLGTVSTGTIGHDINRWWHKVRGKEDPYLRIGEVNDRTKKGESGYVWALRDINFEVKRGEVLGIIGRNGAGKSTLLKILSRTTAPTTGKIKIKGRVASLLEVGTGFHPELSGRENIFLNGAILGMSQQEIKRRFDEIVDFAGVERYIDTPVKRYSSGMYVRLAFAVAAFLEPEILIIDEVLAVGDSEFQKKCLGRMRDVSENEGRTVLFVSHQLGSVQQLCTRTIWIERGKIEVIGNAYATIKQYLDRNSNAYTGHFEASKEEQENDFYIKKFSLLDEDGNLALDFGTQEPITIQVEFGYSSVRENIEIAIALFDKREVRIFTIHEALFTNSSRLTKGVGFLTFKLPREFLAPGTYFFVATIHIPHIQSFHLIKGVCLFNVVETGSKLSDYDGSDIGYVFPPYQLERKL